MFLQGKRDMWKPGLCALLFASASAWGQAYPSKPVRIVAPAAPGGGIDLSARNVSGKLAELWGQQVIVENRPGANFIVGTETVYKSPPDGHTLLVVSSGAVTTNPLTSPNLPYSAPDMTPVMLISAGTFLLVINNALPVKTVPDFISYLRANPGKFFHGSNSPTTILLSELFKALAKVEYSDVNYKGGVLAVAATAAGDTQFAIVDIGSAASQRKAGRVRVLAVTTPQRSKLEPAIPTLAESGLPGYASSSWIIMLAPPKTPAAIVNKVNADLQKVLAAPEMHARFEAFGSEVIASSVEDAVTALRADAEKWAKLVKERNIKLAE